MLVSPISDSPPPFLLLLTFVLLLGTWGSRPATAQYLELKSYAGDPNVRDRLGESVAIDGTLALVGAFRDDQQGLDAGAAYVFRLENGEWKQEAKLVATGSFLDGDLPAGDLFGSVVALSGTVAVIGAPEARQRGSRFGAAYVFERISPGNWVQTARFTPPESSLDDNYATAVATNGEYVMVGALDDDDLGINAGSVYVYRRNGNNWNFREKLLASDGLQGDSFGWYLAMDGNRAVVGARDVDAVAVNAGAAYVFELENGNWIEKKRLLPSDGATDDSFGEVVSLHGDRIVVGARDVNDGTGAAYVYEFAQGGWTEAAKLTASDGAAGDLYGHAVAIRGDRLIVTTRNNNERRGAAYVYERIDGAWQEVTKLAPGDLDPDDQYGQGVGLGDRYAVVTSKHDDDQAEDAGAVYFYDLANTDRGALMALYNATNGPGWKNDANWGTPTPLSTWAGVKTDGEGFVTELALNDNGLDGPLPAAIGTLQRVTLIDLYENALTGALPPALGNLSTLQILRLYTNQFTGTLPTELGALSNLEILALGANGFTGSIPAAYGGMTALREFYIPSNQLDGAVPPEIALLPNLEILRVQFNSLTELPSFAARAGQMTSLRVHTNRFTFEDIEPNIGVSGIEYIPQLPFGESRSISINEGEPLTIDIPIGGANNVYRWFKDGEAIDGATNRVFSRAMASTADAGVYTLEATNTAVAGLTLTSQPVVVEVSNAERFDAHLRSANVLPPFISPASGDLTAVLSESRLIVTGSFQDMNNPYTGAALYIGNPDANGIQVATLNATLAGSGGTFDPERNSFSFASTQLDALRNGRLYAVIFTTRPDAQDAVQEELRGQFYVRPNQAPSASTVTAPTDGALVDLSQAGASLTVSWTAATDPDGHPTYYLWTFSREANFGTVDALYRTDQTPSFTIPLATLDAFLASKGVPPGGTITIYHRVVTTDGSLLTLGDPRALTLKRSVNNAPPFVASAIPDRVHTLGNPDVTIALKRVFSDPESDPLLFGAVSDTPAVAGVLVERDTLFISSETIGRTQITVSAQDPRGGIAQDVFTFTVNAAPELVSTISNQAFVEGDAAFTTSLAPIFSDADPLTYSASSNQPLVATAAIEVDGMTLRVQPAGAGTAVITVTATDDKLATATTSFTVQVQPNRIEPPQSVAETVSLTFGDPTRSTSYRLVGLPGNVALPMNQAIPGVPDVDWVAYRERGNPDAVEGDVYQKYDGSALFDFKPGRGFWLLSKLAWTRSDSRSTVPLNSEDAFEIPLQNGWNILSNPFDIDVPWSAVQALNGISQTLFAWNGAFASATTFASARTGQAYYFFNAENRATLTLPYQPAAVAGEAPARGLTLSALSDAGPASRVVVGRHPDAREGIDTIDQMAPPAGFEVTSLRLVQTDADERRRLLMEEFRPEQLPGYRYDLTLRREAGTPVTLEATGIERVAGEQVVLVDRTLGKTYALDRQPTILLPAGADHTEFVLLIGSDAYISDALSELAPAQVVLTQNYPNPFSSGTIIEYALPEPARVKLVVYDALGRLVQVLVDADLDAGFHTIRWDGTHAGHYPVRSGIYLYRLEAGDTQVVRTMTVIR